MTLPSPGPTRRSPLHAPLPRRPRPELRLPRAAEDLFPRSHAALFGGRRHLLKRLSAGALGTLGRPDPATRIDPELALVRRITQGFQLEEYERAKGLGYEAYLEEQLAPLAIDDFALDARLASYTTLGLSPHDLAAMYPDDISEPYYQFKGAMLVRSTHSKRQLFERMCEFWNDHFCIDHNKGDVEWALLPENDILVTRAHALGSFPSMLSASAHGGAMLYYLDNWLNARGAPQENYARELLELHTLGLHGGYNESDVREVAKCFTGWTLDPNFNSGTFLRGIFVQSQHTPGLKFVLGNEIPNFPPRDDAQRVLDITTAHPGTADFLARKLIRWFLTPEPSEALVQRVATEYLNTNGDIPSVLRVILARENMGPAMPPKKFRRPVHFVLSLLRTLDADVSDALYPLAYLYGMGHVPFDHIQPDGYPDTVEAWGNSLLPRWRFASDLLASVPPFGAPMPGVALSYSSIADKAGFSDAGDRPGLAQRINERLLGRALPPREEDLLQEFIDGTPVFGPNAFLESIALGASLPGYQWY